MKIRTLQKRSYLLGGAAVIASVLVLASPGDDLTRSQALAGAGFDREQTMLMNLQKAPNSSGFFLMMSLSTTKKMIRDIDKSLSQLETVDKAFAKSRGRPDSRYLEPTQLKIVQARSTAEQLENELRSAYLELKKGVQDTIAFDQGKRKK